MNALVARRGTAAFPQNLTLPTIHVTTRDDMVAVVLRLAHADAMAAEHDAIVRKTGA